MAINYETEYRKIVGEQLPPQYKNPEDQGNAIEKCTILRPIGEIEYSSFCKVKKEI